jgi:hypothetical protein
MNLIPHKLDFNQQGTISLVPNCRGVRKKDVNPRPQGVVWPVQDPDHRGRQEPEEASEKGAAGEGQERSSKVGSSA